MARMIRSAICVAFAFGAVVVLQGCGGGGGGGDKTTPAPAPPTSPPTPPPPPTTTTTLKLGPSGLPWCEEVSTFYIKNFVESQETAHGACLPSVSPGAFYTAPGQKAADGKSDKAWSCWSSDFPKFNRNDKEAKAQGYAGACEMRDFNDGKKPDDVPFCSTVQDHHPAICQPGPKMYWGACYSTHTQNWLCIPQETVDPADPTSGKKVPNTKQIAGYAVGDCKATVPMNGATPMPGFFEGSCRFQEEHPKTYKCDTVPTYHPGVATTCGQKVDSTDDKACFSLIDGSQWSCIGNGQSFDSVPPCSWTKDPKGSADKPFYRGRCVFKRDTDDYDSALDASNLTMIAGVNHELFV